MPSDKPEARSVTNQSASRSDQAGSQQANNSAGPPWLPQFGIAEMMLAMLIFCVMAAAGSYWRSAAMSNKSSGKAVFVIFTLCSPVALVMLMSAYVALKRWLRQ